MEKRNVVLGIVAHVDSGKTTLSEGLLYLNGQIRKRGRVDHGDTFLDTDSQERQRGITIFSKQAILEDEKTRMTLLDTPGHVDFIAEMERAIAVLDVAVLVISAQDGVQGHTKTVWKLLKQHNIPCILFLNKMDLPVVGKEEILEQLKTELSGNIIDFSEENQKDSTFMEQLAMGNEILLNSFLDSGKVEKEDIKLAVRKREIIPCFLGSALKLQGVQELLSFLMEYVTTTDYGKNFAARVFKITRDELGNRVTHMKLTGGVLKNRQQITGYDLNHEPWIEKINQIRIYSGDKYEAVQEVSAGMVCAVTGLTKTLPLCGLGAEIERTVPVFEPVLSYRMVLPETVEALAFLPNLRKLEEEEPELHIEWEENSQEIKVKLMGEVQLDIVRQQIKDRYQVDIQWEEGTILYKETVADTTIGIGHFEPLRHYAEAHIRIEPGEPGTGIQIMADCSEDLLAKNWQRLVMTHLGEREYKGVLTGAPLTDVRFVVVGGRSHNKHTQGGDFRQATYRAVRQGLMKGKSVLLEPFYEFELHVPTEFIGRAMTDLEVMYAKFELRESSSGTEDSVLCGLIPVSTVGDYSVRVISYTKGRGHFSCALKGYYPCHNSAAVVEKKAYIPDLDIKNTADSVFCIHGVGEVIPWDRVEKYAHVEIRNGQISQENTNDLEGMKVVTKSMAEREKKVIGVEEIDKLLQQASFANQKRAENGLPGYLKKRGKPVKTDKIHDERAYRPVKKLEKYLLVDGYNVIFAWEDLKELAEVNMDGARGKLMDLLCEYQIMKDMEVILVFDAYRLIGHATEYRDYHNIHVVYTKEAETADFYIEKFSHENSQKYDITVVTSDGLEQMIIRGQGCHLMSSREFKQDIAYVTEKMKREYEEIRMGREEKTFFSDFMGEEDKKNLYKL